MKLIHCADLHLDSRMSTHLGDAAARERRQELFLFLHKHHLSIIA